MLNNFLCNIDHCYGGVKEEGKISGVELKYYTKNLEI